MQVRPPDPPGSLETAGLHLAGLSAVAVAQPVFDLLSRNVEFFAVRGSTRWDIVFFALGLVVIPPLVLLTLEALAGLVHGLAATILHLVFVGGLVGLILLQVIRGVDASSLVLIAAAAAVGVAAALLYARAKPARMLLTVLGAAPIVFLVLFLFVSPTSRLVLEDAPEPRLAEVPATAPVVMVVFDELPTVSLMDSDGEIDAVRYPNFARLAGDATWYRNATTVHEWTTGAVPPMLTGNFPEDDELPLYLDHPDNLFTLLGGAYDLHAQESQAHLCPQSLCDEDREPLVQRVGSLLSDLSIVYGHLVLPEETSRRLPSISTAWRGFGGDGPVVRLQQGPSQPGGRPAAYTERGAEVQEFVDGLEREERPTLSFLHVLLPHHPWEYLPNGKVYAANLGFQPGMVDERWMGDPELATQGWQRHLLQVGYTDLALGRIVDRLEETGLYDDALVVVVADHGVSFRPHGERRRVHPGNLEEIAFVPLFVKAPGQARGEVVDDHVRTIDLLPTMADILGVEIPWQTDGRLDPRTGRRGDRRGSRHLLRRGGRRRRRRARRARDRLLARQIALFGEGNESPASTRSARGPSSSAGASTRSTSLPAAGRPSRATGRAPTTPTRPSRRSGCPGGSTARPGATTSRSPSTARSSPSPGASSTPARRSSRP